jgi:CheY-like chemotaxis protein/nitrogen-specific signal transduction histidine kinase
LEEQSQHLAAQRDELNRAKLSVEAQARDLQQASQYKSDFLANMSHELRTPLNSSLILAKLLADNRDGNLSAEQVKFAETIHAAGNDLLALINDILDLSKIEAGKMEVRPERVRVSQLLENLSRTFQPVAGQKGLTYQAHAAPGAPEVLETDPQRLEQILKNLLGNALKFTEQGEVTLEVRAAPGAQVAFSVRDTGIGISPQQQEMIFEAFRQADGTTNRKYGGTGLGLSISRELARLLGGELSVESEVGRGSIFTVRVPLVYNAAGVPERPAPAPSRSPEPLPAPAPEPPRSAAAPRPRYVEDDRERLTGTRRVVLVVEDDEPFARILLDLAHQLNFHCLIAPSAEEALGLAAQFLPSAVILDIGLPDHSGLSVLDRLKQDARTRHIPVHVVSGGDYAQTALSLGAVGYMLKPVKREELEQAFHSLESRLTQKMRRVLVVEDDAVQLDSLQQLLRSQDVETAGVRTAAECLERLKTSTFDCMVLDLSLPDASGLSLLETLSREDRYSFPPVIVYTGRDLTADEEQQLRRYSKSIIIKGAKSPERLLDEVTLFLHQVVSELPAEQQRMLEKARSRDAALEGRRILVVEDDVRNVFALTSILEPRGAEIRIARNGREALEALERYQHLPEQAADLVLMDIMMPEMDGLTATREIRKRSEWKRLPIIALTAKAMKDDQEQCLEAGANDYMAKPLDVEKLLSLVRVWMPR